MDPFPGTRWSLVLAAGEGHRQVLEDLCSLYWLPLYGFARRRGHSEPDAQDLVQGFLGKFTERNDFERASQEKGRFRAYLLTAFKNHMAKAHEQKTALKRGGGAAHLPLQWETAEGHYQREPIEELTAEHLYERQWALLLVERAVQDTRTHYEKKSQSRLFDALGGVLTGDRLSGTYAELGEQLEMNESAVKVAVHRIKKRFGQALREQVMSTVESADDVEAELRHLLEVLS